MAVGFLAPTSTCSIVATGCANQSGYVWVGLVAAVDNAACAAFYCGASGNGGAIWTLTASQGQGTGLVGPFNTSGSAVYVALTGTRASALVAAN